MAKFCKQYPFKQIDEEDVVAAIIKNKPDIIKNNDFIDKIYLNELSKPGRSTIKLVHISDPHLDLHYKEGSVANCD